MTVATDRFSGIGTTITVASTEPGALAAVREVVESSVASLDRAASRFRPDSELALLSHAGGRPVAVSADLYRALDEAVRAARSTDGLLDPTVGEALERCGYDRDFDSIEPAGPPLVFRFQRVPGWRGIRLDPTYRTVSVPPGVVIDLGATAKAGCADRSATVAAQTVGCGVLVSLGGDIAVAGPPPPDGWVLRVADRHDAAAHEPGVTVAIRSGGLATSGTAARRWQRGGRVMHHIIDPSTGLPAETCWRTVTVAARTCLEANVASTAAVIVGRAAPGWLAQRGHHARLVAENGNVVLVGWWPPEGSSAVDPSREMAPC